MIILYDKNEQAFTSLGIGVLDDAISCTVTEELNGAFELEMEYPITGVHYTDIQEERIIYAKASDLLSFQPFRIYKITRPIDGTVTVCAEHISYDMGTVPIRKLNAENLADLAGPNGKIQNGKMIDSPFTFLVGSDKAGGTEITFKTSIPHNMRALLMGSDDSILNIYKGEYIFDKFNVTLCDRRGKDRGFAIRYSKNMIDLEQETSSELMFNGVCPFYSNTTTETKVGIGKKYKEIYISKETVTPLKDEDGNDIYPSTWLTYKSSGLEAITNILSLTTTNIIATEGDFFNHLVRAKKCVPQGSTEEGSYFFDATYNIAYINPKADEGDWSWLYKDEDITEIWQPNNGDLFRIYTPGDKLYKVYIFEGDWAGRTGTYRQITSSDNIPEYPPTIPSVDNTQEEKSLVILYEGDIIYLNEVRATPKEGETAYSATWLQAVSEELQVIASDNRWKVESDIVQTIGVPSKTIYKVPTIEVNTRAYPIEGAKEYTRGWLSLVQGSDKPIPDEDLIDGHGYEVERADHTIYKCRWSADDNKYNHMVDTRYTYTNYEWNGQTYIPHPTVNDKIHTVDLSDKFKETPKDTAKFQKDIYDETIKYITDNKLGILKNNIKVSFVKLSSSPEYSKWKELETVVLGDTVHVIYEDLGVNEEKKVIKTEYNSLTETYDSIEIGDKGSTFVNNAIVAGDSVSALTNDRNFADITTVTSLVAERIKAEYIQAVTAEITEAQIETLTTNELNATLITAQKFEIDNLVASLLTADDAAIRNTLVVGDNLIVNGEVNILNGSISISGQERIDSCKTAYYNSQATQYDIDWLLSDPNDSSSVITPELGIWYKVIDQLNLPHYYTWQLPTNDEDGKYIEKTVNSDVYFEVDESGNVTANSLTITGGSIEIEGPSGSGTSFSVTNEGYLTANGANIQGEITADSGVIGNCQINSDGDLIIPSGHVTGTFSANVLNGGTITGCEISIGPISGTNPTQYNFEVDSHGDVTANSITITGGSINLSGSNSTFGVDQNGNLSANSVTLTGGTIENLNITGTIYFGNRNMVYAYIRGQHIRYIHSPRFVMDQSAVVQDLEVCEVVLPFVDYNGNSLADSGYYLSDCFDVPSDIFLDVERMKEYGDIKIISQQLPDDYDMWFHIYHHGTSHYTVWNITSTDGISYTTERDEDVLEITEDTVKDLTSYTSSWLSIHDPSTDGQDGEPLTPDSSKTYVVYDDSGRVPGHQSQFIGLYKWVNNKFVLQSYSDIYCINEYGLHLPGIDATIDETKIASFTVDEYKMVSTNLPDTAPSDPDTEFNEVGISAVQSEEYAFWVGKIKYPSQNNQGLNPDPVFYVTHEGYMKATSGMISSYKMYNAFLYHSETLGDIYDDILSTNEDKVNMYDTEDGVTITSLGIGMYDSTSSSKITISQFTGITAPTILLDPFRNASDWREDPFQLGTLPMLYGGIDKGSDLEFLADMYSDTYPDVDYLSIDDAWNLQYTCYMRIIKTITIPRNTSKKIRYAEQPHHVSIYPDGPLYNNDISIIAAFPTVVNDIAVASAIMSPTVTIDRNDNAITVRNDNGIPITIDLLVFFTNDDPLPVVVDPDDPWSRIKK